MFKVEQHDSGVAVTSNIGIVTIEKDEKSAVIIADFLNRECKASGFDMTKMPQIVRAFYLHASGEMSKQQAFAYIEWAQYNMKGINT